MSTTTRDVTSQTDVRQFKLEADGTFKRPDAQFRHFIEKGVEYEPEKKIIRMFNAAFRDHLLPAPTPTLSPSLKIDLYPAALRAEIDELNAWVYDDINNGVYKPGMAATQPAYEASITNLFTRAHPLR
ncbi:S-glutathionyl-(chloro)hydroquinone reductase [Steccherinum ochraceum]|uniref:S-glutathionyl-(Chloro)hydroquinone reductase n=1 Tax=Steccherinum ochraceum TaxID=92696 RepID=A0A4R0RB68_9APHY|nr:S-glutathionyl-(chloro)hydroquinone reductase [Steccherinum ochraceum]